eukprot:TRINITY_DN28027_c0_g1_i1.p2 TRINITY_DN28027_c0_g1~~TRINITY_DN28027_c0_g1_i1.p2  ORF type:complete len:188 (+),score=41.49 TRINITY_DN28027_c0_g1_i1:64-627(+)
MSVMPMAASYAMVVPSPSPCFGIAGNMILGVWPLPPLMGTLPQMPTSPPAAGVAVPEVAAAMAVPTMTLADMVRAVPTPAVEVSGPPSRRASDLSGSSAALTQISGVSEDAGTPAAPALVSDSPKAYNSQKVRRLLKALSVRLNDRRLLQEARDTAGVERLNREIADIRKKLAELGVEQPSHLKGRK